MKRKIVAGICLWYVLMLVVASRRGEAIPQHTPTPINPVQVKIERFVKDKYIAEEISKAKRPYIVAAIGKVESDYRPQVYGDGGESFGLFQIQRKHHGRFSDRIQSQVAKCESIIEPLIAKHGVEEGVRRYNGSGAKARAYARRVLTIARQIERG